MNRGIGKGKVVRNEMGVSYKGTMPFEHDETVLIIRESDLKAILESETELLKQTGKDIPKMFYDRTGGRQPLLVGEIVYSDGEIDWRLFLDRHFYASNPKNELWVRYANVDQFDEDEGNNE